MKWCIEEETAVFQIPLFLAKTKFCEIEDFLDHGTKTLNLTKRGFSFSAK